MSHPASTRVRPDEGATIVIDIADPPYGGRGHARKDPDGHYGWFDSDGPWAEQWP